MDSKLSPYLKQTKQHSKAPLAKSRHDPGDYSKAKPKNLSVHPKNNNDHHHHHNAEKNGQNNSNNNPSSTKSQEKSLSVKIENSPYFPWKQFRNPHHHNHLHNNHPYYNHHHHEKSNNPAAAAARPGFKVNNKHNPVTENSTAPKNPYRILYREVKDFEVKAKQEMLQLRKNDVAKAKQITKTRNENVKLKQQIQELSKYVKSTEAECGKLENKCRQMEAELLQAQIRQQEEILKQVQMQNNSGIRGNQNSVLPELLNNNNNSKNNTSGRQGDGTEQEMTPTSPRQEQQHKKQQ